MRQILLGRRGDRRRRHFGHMGLPPRVYTYSGKWPYRATAYRRKAAARGCGVPAPSRHNAVDKELWHPRGRTDYVGETQIIWGFRDTKNPQRLRDQHRGCASAERRSAPLRLRRRYFGNMGPLGRFIPISDPRHSATLCRRNAAARGGGLPPL